MPKYSIYRIHNGKNVSAVAHRVEGARPLFALEAAIEQWPHLFSGPRIDHRDRYLVVQANADYPVAGMYTVEQAVPAPPPLVVRHASF